MQLLFCRSSISMAKWFCNLILSIFQPKIVGQHQLIRKKEAPSYTQHKSEFSKSVNKISAQISTLPSAPLLFLIFKILFLNRSMMPKNLSKQYSDPNKVPTKKDMLYSYYSYSIRVIRNVSDQNSLSMPIAHLSDIFKGPVVKQLLPDSPDTDQNVIIL